jgi:hypothetical protein
VDKWKGRRSKHTLEVKKIKCTYSNDTRTHYLMEQDPLLLKDQVDGMDVVATDKVEVLKNKYGPSRVRLKSICLSVLHV